MRIPYIKTQQPMIRPINKSVRVQKDKKDKTLIQRQSESKFDKRV